MFTMVIGAAGSGKSEYAEGLVTRLGGPRIYLATMEPFGEEARARVLRHRETRKGKGFLTLERFTDLGSLALPAGANLLLEDLGNLLANELYGEAGNGPEAAHEGVLRLAGKCRHLTLVTNEVGAGGSDYEAATLAYMKELGRLNCRLAARADRLIEVIAGLPRVRKEGGHVGF